MNWNLATKFGSLVIKGYDFIILLIAKEYLKMELGDYKTEED
jgi:hypothetical protein